MNTYVNIPVIAKATFVKRLAWIRATSTVGWLRCRMQDFFYAKVRTKDCFPILAVAY